MARIRLRLGDREIEVDSRDFYVDNQTLGEVVESLSARLPENRAELVPAAAPAHAAGYALGGMDDAEAFEPEFADPRHVAPADLRPKLRILETGRYFDSPRTVTDVVSQLREYGWAASPLDVSKVLARMASRKEIIRSHQGGQTRYSAAQKLVA